MSKRYSAQIYSLCYLGMVKGEVRALWDSTVISLLGHRTPFRQALAQDSRANPSRTIMVAEKLLAHGIPIDEPLTLVHECSVYSRTLLQFTAEEGGPALAECLVRNGADPFRRLGVLPKDRAGTYISDDEWIHGEIGRAHV